MDWMAIVSAHMMRKQRLAGEGADALDPDAIRPGDRCTPGKRIDGDGAPMPGLRGYEDVHTLHAQVHRKTAEAARPYLANHTTDVDALLHGEYNKLSERLRHRIPGLSGQLTAAGIQRF